MAIVDPFDNAPSSSVTVSGIVDPFETQASQPTQQDKVSNFSYIANQAKLGLTDSAVLGQSLIDTFAVQPFKGLVTGEKQPTFSENVKRLQRAAGTFTGATEETKAPSAVSEIVGGGARMLSDPLGYAGTGLFWNSSRSEFIAIGSQARVATSTDAVTWTYRTQVPAVTAATLPNVVVTVSSIGI